MTAALRWLRRLRHGGLPPADPSRTERTAELAAELRIHARQLTAIANRLAAVHGVERRTDETRPA